MTSASKPPVIDIDGPENEDWIKQVTRRRDARRSVDDMASAWADAAVSAIAKDKGWAPGPNAGWKRKDDATRVPDHMRNQVAQGTSGDFDLAALREEVADWPLAEKSYAQAAFNRVANEPDVNLLTTRAKDGTLQSVASYAIVEDGLLEVDLLTSNGPAGTGRATMRHLAATAAKEGRGMTVHAARASREFYEQIGMTATAEGVYAFTPEETAAFAKGEPIQKDKGWMPGDNAMWRRRDGTVDKPWVPGSPDPGSEPPKPTPERKPEPKPASKPEAPKPKGKTKLPYRPGKEAASTVEENQKNYWDQHPELHEMGTLEEVKAKAAAHLQAAVSDHPIATRTDVHAAEGVLDDARFKTTFETLTSTGGESGDEESGVWYREARASAEHRGMGVPENISPNLRPVYGYSVGHAGDADAYGEVEWILKDECKTRATLCVGDSLPQFDGGEAIGTPYLEPTAASINAYDLPILARDDTSAPGLTDVGAYVEVQVHGGVTLGDVAKVVIHDPGYPTGSKYARKVDELKRRLTGLGLTVEDHRGAE